ncbi:MAG TPA: DUF2784 family protein [Mycobacteriales bacterium]|nr:DUF2784 family protein [Mycobacteriales bacterium]
MLLALADVVAALHAAVVVLVVAGGLVSLRRPRLLVVHAVALTAVVAVYLLGADCPLTRLELALREAGGQQPYRDGFLGHYLFSPLGLDVRSAVGQAVQLVAVVVPNAVAYGVLLSRRLPHRAPA